MKRSLLFGLLSPLFLNACAALQQGDAMYEEKNLEKAGFHVTSVEAPRQRAALAKMTPYKLQAEVEKGKTVYLYADPKEQKIYSGGPREFAAYQQIRIREQQNNPASVAARTNWAGEAFLMR